VTIDTGECDLVNAPVTNRSGKLAGPGGYRQNVRSAIKRIRNKFRDLDPTFDGIETFTNFGYRWKI
jgi:hypothetical protein